MSKSSLKQNRAWREKNPHKIREYYLKYSFGITKEQYSVMLAAQGGGCAICGGSNADGRNLFIDHDHVTGQIRGLLCNNCNSALGKFKDSPKLLENAITYLKKHKDGKEG